MRDPLLLLEDILEDEAVGRREAELLRRKQVDVGEALAAADFVQHREGIEKIVYAVVASQVTGVMIGNPLRVLPFQLEPSMFLDTIHGGRGCAFFGATLSLSQLGHLGSFFSSSYTRKARPQSLHSYSLPGIFSHLLGPVSNRSIVYYI